MAIIASYYRTADRNRLVLFIIQKIVEILRLNKIFKKVPENKHPYSKKGAYFQNGTVPYMQYVIGSYDFGIILAEIS